MNKTARQNIPPYDTTQNMCVSGWLGGAESFWYNVLLEFAFVQYKHSPTRAHTQIHSKFRLHGKYFEQHLNVSEAFVQTFDEKLL